LPDRPRQIVGASLCLLATILVLTPWMVRNYRTFGRLSFVRDNLPLELYEANNTESGGMWTRSEHPGNDPVAMRRFQELGEVGFMDEKRQQLLQYIRWNPERFLWFTVERTFYFWIAPPQATIVEGYDLRFSRHFNFFLGAAVAFAGLWLTIQRRKFGWFLLSCLLLIYPLPYYLVTPFPRYKHPIEPVMLLLIVYLFWESRHIEIHWPPLRKSL